MVALFQMNTACLVSCLSAFLFLSIFNNTRAFRPITTNTKLIPVPTTTPTTPTTIATTGIVNSSAILVEQNISPEYLQLDNNPWNSCVPSLFSSLRKMRKAILSNNNNRHNNSNNIDVTMQWNSDRDNTKEVANSMMRKIIEKKHLLEENDRDTSHHDYCSSCCQGQLMDSMDMFVRFCQTNLLCGGKESAGEKHHPTHFKARMVITRGPDGTKCPQWHYDHVPVRWVQSLVGPGCDFVVPGGGIESRRKCNNGNGTRQQEQQQTGINWKEFQYLWNGEDDAVTHTIDDDDDDQNNSDDEISYSSTLTTEERNNQLVDPLVANINQVPPGQAILLLGSEWNQFSAAKASLAPAIHKSPTIPWWQGRVLLSMDVVVDDDEHS